MASSLYHTYLGNVIQSVKKSNWLITSYEVDIDSLYDPSNYLFNINVEGYQYILVPDRNIFSYMISSATTDKSSEYYRQAIGLILFCQESEIQIEPNLSIYEYINYDITKIESALNEIEIFHSLNNYNEKPIYDYFLGNINQIPIKGGAMKRNRESLREELKENLWLKEWKSLYLMILKLVEISLKNLTKEEKLKQLLMWLHREFRISHVAIFFSLYLFSSKRLGSMIKYKTNMSKEEKILALRNMTWDLYYMNSYFRQWQNKAERQEYLFASNDNVVREILQSAIRAAKSENWDFLKNILTQSEFLSFNEIFIFLKENKDRKYQSSEWSEECREGLIKEVELKLL